MHTHQQPKKHARRLLIGAAVLPENPDELLALVMKLKNIKEFGLARQLLQKYRAFNPSLAEEKLRQQHAVCTYKDEELLSENSLEEALAILAGGSARLPMTEAIRTLEKSDNSETLSIAGAILKRFWGISGRRDWLERAGVFYQRACDAGRKAKDTDAWSYAAINAAFLLEMQAETLLHPAEDGDARCETLWQRAKKYRLDVLEAFDQPSEKTGQLSWWASATLAEALMGLGQYARAQEILQRAQSGAPDWELESAARQLAALAELHGRVSRPGLSGEAAASVPAVLVDNPELVQALGVGKVGLALSGGGFRAALYHIGTLACLADRDLLRWVEVLSCVSGGSIVGALYYLELRNRLERQPGLSREDYVDMVEQVRQNLSKLLEGNLRMAALWEWLNPFRPGNFTWGVGRLLGERLYARVGGGTEAYPIAMRDLYIHPLGTREGATFHPRRNNWNRHDKVPILILNATSLNTGHNWQFTASWMGEAPSCIEERVDATERLRRFYYDDEQPDLFYRDMTLGTAVAASACVPFPFPPIVFPNLYPERTVRLVDGGVDDNQGIFGLLEQDCSLMIVSDGSGQLQTVRKPCGFMGSVVIRANDIMMQSVRRGLFRLLEMRKRSGWLKDLLFVHMKQGLHEPDVAISSVKGPPQPAHRTAVKTTLRADVQTALAALRTDLDHFSAIERDALMYAGYMQTQATLDADPQRPLLRLAKALPQKRRWLFLQAARWASSSGDPDEEGRQNLLELKRGKRRILRGWYRLWKKA
ncbi:MAG: patatin-like phospholipase family protein [Magnetococcus sp. MYC-9]